MRTRMSSLMPVLAGCLLFGCVLVSEPELDEEFRLAPGQAAVIAGTDLTVTFRKVVTDSRCPSTALCVWIGNGEVELAVRTESGGFTPYILGTPSGPLQVAIGPYRIRLLGLDPYPAGPPIPDEEYRVRLKVSTE